MNKGTVLLIDDEPALRELLTGYLTRLGYDVEACASGAEAFARFEQHPSGYPLVITDAQLPGLRGEDLVPRMAELRRDLRVVVMSGVPVAPLLLPPGFLGRVQFLQKPFRPVELAQAIESLLGA
ncbi:MAG: response regulator [Bryobacteraceae bacterium]